MEYKYEDCLAQTLHQVKHYNTLRNNKDLWDKWEFQDIRDELSEALVYFGPFYADLRADAEQRDIDYKIYLEERKNHWRGVYGGVRGTASQVDSNALIDCKQHLKDKTEANRAYYQARALQDRIDQVLNSLASRLKILEKHDKEG